MTDITDPPERPSRGTDDATFSAQIDAWFAWIISFYYWLKDILAALSNYSTNSTSTTNNTIGTGAKSFTVGTGKSFWPGMQITIADAAAPAVNLMLGTVTAYNSTTGALTAQIKKYIGSGTKSNWVISVAANATFEKSRGAVAMHATAMDLWSQPEVIDGTGAAVTVTDLADAPQAGASRIFYPVAGTVITNNSTLKVQGDADAVIADGDTVVIIAITTSNFSVLVIRRPAISNQIGDVIMSLDESRPGCLKVPPAPTTISRTTYAKLFAKAGTKWGAGDGVTTFGLLSLPNDQAMVRAADSSAVGTYTVGQILAHLHTYMRFYPGQPGGYGEGGSGNFGYTSTNTSTEGGSANLAAGMRINFFVVYDV